MGSRPEINVFILQMTQANEQKWCKRNENKNISNERFGPFAWCNRKPGSCNEAEQNEAQCDAYAALIHYVAKVNSAI